MANRYACFISYAQGQFDLMNKFKTELIAALRCYLEPYLDNETELFIDTEQLGGGDDLERKIARAMCESAAMILIYTPRYELHKFTRREHAAMQLIEAERAAWYELPSRLIIPVIMTRHPVGLPPQIANSTMYVDFSRFTMATPDLKSNPQFIPAIEKIVTRIVQHVELQKISTPSSHDCNQFVLPAVPPEWRSVPSSLPILSFPKK